MRQAIKRSAVVIAALMIITAMMPAMGSLPGGFPAAAEVYAETTVDVTQDGFKFRLWIGEAGASVALMGYTGTASEIILPVSVTYNGKTYKVSDNTGFFHIAENAFAGNKTIVKVAIPSGYEAISPGAFKGCTSLTEVAIADSVQYIEADIFDDCSKLTKYYYSGKGIADTYPSESDAIKALIDSGLGQDADGNPRSGVTVYTTAGSVVEKAVQEINSGSTNGNKITVKTVADPYSQISINSNTETKGADGTAYGKGASESVLNKAITAYKAEKDPAGTVFNLLQLQASKVAKTSIKLKWKKVKSAKKYVIYGNKCGKKNKLVKLKTVKSAKTTTSKFTKVNKKKIKKGTYYKFIIVAFDKNNKVISTSKIVHVVTSGGKYCNDKKVTTKAKGNKVTVKKGKQFKLKGKAVKESKSKKVRTHRKLSYESSDKKIATVSSKGVIKGKKKGTCYVYAYAQKGVFAKVKVTVK